MPRTLNCPNCAAPLDYDGGTDYTITCPFCSSSVIVPAELRTQVPATFSLTNLPDIVGQAQNLAEMARLVRSGKKIEAIKMYRQIFGVGLKEAKDAIEALEKGRSVQLSNMTPGAPMVIDMRPSAKKRKINWLIVALIVFFGGPMIMPLIMVPCGLLFGLLPVQSNVVVSPNLAIDTPTRIPSATTVPTPTPTPGFASVALKFGGSGTGPGLFTDARSIALDGANNIYVGDYIGGRIQVFDADGKFTTQWNVDARAPLRGLAADRKGTVYIAQNGAILKFQGTTGKSLGPYEFAEGNRFDSVTVLPDGGLLAMWYSQRSGIFTTTVGFRDDLVRFDADGKAVKVLPVFLSGLTSSVELDTKIAVDGAGNIFALGGAFNPAVHKFNRDGKFENKFGSRGNEPGQFRSPNAITIDNQSRVYVADSAGILVFAPDGRYLDTFRVESGSPSGMVFNDKNELFIVARTQVYKYVLNRR